MQAQGAEAFHKAMFQSLDGITLLGLMFELSRSCLAPLVESGSSPWITGLGMSFGMFPERSIPT